MPPGRNGQHAHVRMHLPRDENYEEARMTMLCMFTDLKHSKPWTCEFCSGSFLYVPGTEVH